MTVNCATSRLLRISGLHLHRLSLQCQPASWIHSSSNLRSLLSPSETSEVENQLSYHCETAVTPMVTWTFGRCINRAAAVAPDKIVYTFDELKKKFTFAEFHDQVDRCAKGLLAAGISKGDGLMIFAPNIVNWMVMFAACAKIGVLSASVHPAYTQQEFFSALDKVKPKAIFMPDEFEPLKFYENLCKWIPELSSSTPGQLNSPRFPSLKTVIVDSKKSLPGTVNMQEILGGNRANIEEVEVKVGSDDPLTVIFTSGTTGAAKAACLTHHGLINNAVLVNELWNVPETDAPILSPLPLFHVFGLMNATLPLISLQQTVFPSIGYNQLAVMRCIQEYKCSRLNGSPTMFFDLINHPERSKYDLSSITACFMGGAVCTPEMKKMVESELHCLAVTGYGATETSTVCSLVRPDDPLEKRMHTVGRPLPHLEIKVADPQTGVEVPRNETGEVWIRGFSIFNGYVGEEAKTREVITSSRWYRSGDVGVMDEDGYLNVVGRLKDLIIRGGENIHPLDIELELDRHPAVEESHVVGVPDQRLGEEVCAVVVMRDGAKVSADELKAHLKGRLAYFKIPKYFLFELDVPRTAIGKPQKNKIRATAAEKLGLK